ncbi:hypothetical protein BX600DRAFT_509352 [Xylariales sp. PMI_506]|nr:hypothetical protein BX600DRAFT_509352 [Xylariales sp. PMI_506]
MEAADENGDPTHNLPPPYSRGTVVSAVPVRNIDAHMDEPAPPYTETIHPPKTGQAQSQPTKTNIRGCKCYAVFAITAIFLLVVVGTAVGVTLRGEMSDKASASYQSATPLPRPIPQNRHILAGSQLAATVASDDGSSTISVFFQDPYESLIALRKSDDSESLGWQATNITALFSDSSNPVRPLPGSAIAAASCSGYACDQTNVWYESAGNNIVILVDSSIAEEHGGWQVGNNLLNYASGEDILTNLAATYIPESDTNVTGSFVIMYQTFELQLYMYNYSNIGDLAYMVSDQEVSKLQSSIALAPRRNSNNTSTYDLELVAEVFTGEGNSYAIKTMSYSNGNWTSYPPGLNQADETANPKFAVTMLNNWVDTYYIVQFSNHTLSGWITGQNNQTILQIDISSGPEINAFDAIATTLDGSFYGIYGDSILEYSFNATDPSILVYKGVIYPPAS